MHRILATVIALVVALVMTPSVATAADRTDRTNLSFTSDGVKGTYHLYAAGLDWTKPVGLLAYTDGTGEWGLNRPDSNYLLAGTNGLIAVAKRNNMVLVTPMAPGGGCACWHETSSGYTAKQKAQWSADLIEKVVADYDLDTDRMAVGGYSSGATWTTGYYVPGHASRVMTDGVTVAIAYGGPPTVTNTITSEFKAAVHMHWDSGSEDSATDIRWGARDGYNWYSSHGFSTSIDIPPGVGHGRSGEFGSIMEAQIKKHVPTGSAAPTPSPQPPAPEPNPDGPVRLSGDNRYATSVAVSQYVSSTAYDRANTLVLVNAWATADALSASSLGGTVLLLPDSDSVPTVIRDEIVRRDPAHVYIVGGTAVVSRQQEQIIASLLD